jgi:SAM-dependent MidA family methyltransferase
VDWGGHYFASGFQCVFITAVPITKLFANTFVNSFVISTAAVRALKEAMVPIYELGPSTP